MWAINALFLSFSRAISSPDPPRSFPSITPSNHAARLPRFLAGATHLRRRPLPFPATRARVRPQGPSHLHLLVQAHLTDPFPDFSAVSFVELKGDRAAVTAAAHRRCFPEVENDFEAAIGLPVRSRASPCPRRARRSPEGLVRQLRQPAPPSSPFPGDSAPLGEKSPRTLYVYRVVVFVTSRAPVQVVSERAR